MLIPGLVSITFRKLPPNEIINLVVRAELQSMEWGGDVHVPNGEIDTALQVQRMTRDEKLDISAYGSYYRVGESEEEGLSFKSVLDTAESLGAPTIRVWAGTKSSQDADSNYRAQIIKDSCRLAEMAWQRDISISFEHHRNTLTDTNKSAQSLLEDANHPNIYTFWQMSDHRSLKEMHIGFSQILNKLSNLHVFHWKDSHHCPLSDGKDE